MGEGSWTVVYLLLGLGLVAGLYYALTQIMARQSRLNAELTRLERLAAEVAMNAEAILDRVDERIDVLNRLAEEIEEKAKAKAAGAVAVAAELQTGVAAAGPAAPGTEQAAGSPRPRNRKRSALKPSEGPSQVTSAKPETSQPEQTPTPEPAKDEPPNDEAAPAQYRDARLAVFALADEGKDAGEIAQALGIPRGEVQLILNLRGRKVNG